MEHQWRHSVCIVIYMITVNTSCWVPPLAEWLSPLIFSALNRSSSHHCGFEPSSCHM